MLLLLYAGAAAQESPAVGRFRLVQERREWADAEERCVGLGGHLASVHDAEEATAVSELCLSHLGEGGGCWIGLNDMGHEGSFEWSDGSPLDFVNWNPGEPDSNGHGDAAYIYTGGDEAKASQGWATGKWDDNKPTSAKGAFVCKLGSYPVARWKRFPFAWPASVPLPLAYYWLDDGEGSQLHDSISGSVRGSVTYELADQPSPYPGANWVGDSKFGTTIACGSAATGQKDTLELADLDYGTSGAWALNFWVRNPPGSDFEGAQREQFFGHGDPLLPTTTRNQVHLQFESSGAIRTIVYDGSDADRNSICAPPCTACDDSQSAECRATRSSVVASTDTTPVFGSVSDEQWHMLTLTTHPGISRTKGYTLYIDGETRANSPHIDGVGMDNYRGDPAARAQAANGGDPIQPKGPMRLCERAIESATPRSPTLSQSSCRAPTRTIPTYIPKRSTTPTSYHLSTSRRGLHAQVRPCDG